MELHLKFHNYLHKLIRMKNDKGCSYDLPCYDFIHNFMTSFMYNQVESNHKTLVHVCTNFSEEKELKCFQEHNEY